MMVGSFAVLPVAALLRAAPASTSAIDTLATASADVSDYLSSLERWDGGSLAIHPALSDASIPVEVIIQFQGRSLAAEQMYRAEQGFAKLDGAAQQAYVAGVRASHVDLRAAIIAAGGVVRREQSDPHRGRNVPDREGNRWDGSRRRGVRRARCARSRRALHCNPGGRPGST